ncbi:MAG: putative beta-lysine N-acetyltransferase [Firmicutes bacterium]|nr:putative beta-lysine N-acetyltransferase [Bacillota bacterium]
MLNTRLHQKNGSFTIDAIIDQTNQRIWVSNYNFSNAPEFTDFLIQNAYQNSADKVIIPARDNDVGALENQGFVLEGRAEGFFNGDTAYFMSAYPSAKRRQSINLKNKMDQLQKIISMPLKPSNKLPEGYIVRNAVPDDAKALAILYDKVFSTYPTPLNDSEYIQKLMNNDTYFLLIEYNGDIASAAAAEIDAENGNAEMTNCATNPEHQGKGLMSILMNDLENMVLKKDIKCLYSLSRSSEFGINLIFHRLGYSYCGTLINNCHICNTWEDMHLWVKTKFSPIS